MLRCCEIKVEELCKDFSEISSILDKYPLQNTYAFCENKLEAFLVPMSEFTWSKFTLNDTLRLVIFNEAMEIRIEKDIESSFFYIRILEELMQDGEFYTKDENLMLRKSRAISKKIFTDNKICSREYFKADEYGMLIFYTDRLAIAQTGR